MHASLVHEIATEAAKAAATILRHAFRKPLKVSHKSSVNLITEADLAAEKAIISILQQAFPEDQFLAEESHASLEKPTRGLWIIDPLDGTNNFAHGLEQYGISIARWENGAVHYGLVVRPESDDWFVASRGEGAWYNGNRAEVTDAKAISDALLGVGFYYDRGTMMRATLAAMEQLFLCGTQGFRRMGAASLDLCMVGCGMLGAYFEYTLSPWDFAAGKLFVEEAGGRVTDCLGNEVDIAQSSILASNRAIHVEVLDVVRNHFPGSTRAD